MSPTQRHSHVVIGVRLLPCRQACRRAASRAREVFEPSFRGQSAAQGYLYLFIPPTTTPHFGNYVDAKFLSFRGAKSAAQRLIIMHYTPHFGNYASATRRYVNLDVNQLESAENRCSLRARTHAGSISPRGFQVRFCVSRVPKCPVFVGTRHQWSQPNLPRIQSGCLRNL